MVQIKHLTMYFNTLHSTAKLHVSAECSIRVVNECSIRVVNECSIRVSQSVVCITNTNSYILICHKTFEITFSACIVFHTD